MSLLNKSDLYGHLLFGRMATDRMATGNCITMELSQSLHEPDKVIREFLNDELLFGL